LKKRGYYLNIKIQHCVGEIKCFLLTQHYLTILLYALDIPGYQYTIDMH